MRWKIIRHGSHKNEICPTPEQQSANKFFEWLESLTPRDNGKTCRMPMGQTATFISHDIFNGTRYVENDAAWYFLPSLPTTFHGSSYFVCKRGARVFVAMYHGEKSDQVAIFESASMALVLPPVGIRIPGSDVGTVLPLHDEIGVRMGDVIDHLISDAESQRFLRIIATPTTNAEYLTIELTAPEFAHCIFNPSDSPYREMFAA